MRILVYSDLHVEMGDFTPPSDLEYDVVVLAGDISTKARLVAWAKSKFTKPVVAVAGNHDLWGSSIDHGPEKMLDQSKDSNVHFLHNHDVVIDGVRFLGCTLWTDFNLYGNQPLSALHANMNMRDFKKIRGYGFRKFTPEFWMTENAKSKRFIQEKLMSEFPGKTVAVTHHAPCEQSIDQVFIGDPLSPAYASNYDYLVDACDLWIHGHVHTSNDYMIGNGRVVSNPRGYYGVELNKNFNPGLVIDI